jgi:hypothetical protein
LIDEWVRPFLGQLEALVSEYQGRDIRVFKDYRVLELGSGWHAEAEHALSTSKLLLAIVTPRYFLSQWTVAEWKTFEERERVMMKRELVPLIFPVLVVDPGDQAPGWFRARVYFDMRENSLRQDLRRRSITRACKRP